MYCKGCGAKLLGRPKIDIDNSLYCYICAKKEVPTRQLARQRVVDSEFESEKAIYDKEYAVYSQIHRAWLVRRNDFVGNGCGGCLLGIFGAVVAYCIAESFSRGIGIIGVIASFFLWGSLSSGYKKRKNDEFLNNCPEPECVVPLPQRHQVTPVKHTPQNNDGSVLHSRKNYRREILHRDELVCQVCGKKRQSKSLEVHHIIPRSKGGCDDPTNLVSLCKYCHDREKWYGHKRGYATTLKQRRSS